MAIKNTVSLYINGVNYSRKLVLPFDVSRFLDERLDEVNISLRAVKKEYFKPLSVVEFTLHNLLYYGQPKPHYTEMLAEPKLRFLVAVDNVTENPNGKGFYDHELYLIEETKYLECFICDTVTFTNDMGRTYASNPKKITPTKTTYKYPAPVFNDINDSTYLNPLKSGTDFTFLCPRNFFPRADFYNVTSDLRCTLTLKTPADTITIVEPNSNNKPNDITLNLQEGYYTLTYEASNYFNFNLEGSVTYVYNFVVVQNFKPLKRYTITDVINRLLDIVEPIYKGDKPRFHLEGVTRNENGTFTIAKDSLADRLEKVIAPEFAFTQKTLRECLQQIGGFIHGEPRLVDGNTITFDMYGDNKGSPIVERPYAMKKYGFAMERHCDHIDSTAQNLINQLDYAQGVIIEPYSGGFKTVRTETAYVRITDGNMIITTQYPIYDVISVKSGIIPNNNT